MRVTRGQIVDRLSAYLHHELDEAALVAWAERAMMEAEFDEHDHDVIRDAVARLGVADVRAFGLTWADCERLLGQLGCTAEIRVAATA